MRRHAGKISERVLIYTLEDRAYSSLANKETRIMTALQLRSLPRLEKNRKKNGLLEHFNIFQSHK